MLPRGVSVASLPGYEEGWFVVQDPATALSVDLLAPRGVSSIGCLCGTGWKNDLDGESDAASGRRYCGDGVTCRSVAEIGG